MGRAIIRCEAVGRPTLNRRSVLAAALAASLPMAGASASTHQADLVDLMGVDGAPSPLARSLASSLISIRGYLAPSLDGREFTLTGQPPMPCQLCGAAHDAGYGLQVFTALPDPGAPMLQQVRVSGRLELDAAPPSGLRLVDARIQAA